MITTSIILSDDLELMNMKIMIICRLMMNLLMNHVGILFYQRQ